MKRARTFVAVALAACALGATPSCTTERTDSGVAGEPATTTQAAGELAKLRDRFPTLATLLRAPAPPDTAGPPAVRVSLPATSSADTVVEDVASAVGVRVRLEGRSRGSRVDVDGLSVYPGAGIVLRSTEHGAEDLVSFDTRPSAEEAVYTIAPIGAAGLRLVENALELLDARGTPRLRMAAPYVVDSAGARVDANVTIEGCAFDASPVGPWGRPVTPIGATQCTLRLAWHAASYPVLLDPSWTVTQQPGAPRAKHTVVKLANGKVLMFYGETCGGGCLLAGGAYLYDPVTKTWAGTNAGGLGIGKGTDTSAVLLSNGKALSLTGAVGPVLYDPATGMFAAAGALPGTRGGTSTLTPIAGGKVLCAGGDAGGTADLYDVAANTFTSLGAMKAVRNSHAAAVLASGKVLLVGGSGDLTSAEIYDPVAKTFTLTGSMSFGRTAPGAFTLASGKVLVVGGGPQQAEIYDPATGVFTKTGSFAVPRKGVASALMPSGNVYVAGGYLDKNPPAAGLIPATSLVERFDPATGLFTLAPTMVKVRGDLRLTLLDSSSLFATGGNIDTFGTQSQDGGEELSVSVAGGTCSINDDCASGICDQGICCAATCTGTCKSCVAGTGACVTVTGADDPSSCTGANTCDATGACKSKQGRACMADSECSTGFCTDGVCCDRACKGVCEACDLNAAGICETVAGKPHGSRTCATDGSNCGGACDGKVATTCAFPGVQTGCGTGCKDDLRTAGACDGKGACTAQATRPCPGNYSCADASSCRVTCTTNADCAHGYGCTGGKCFPIAACDGDHTIVSADGKSKTDCSPFRCDNTTNTCITSCVDVAGCTEPFLCDQGGQCVAPPKAPSGCASSPANPGSASGMGALASLLLAAVIARRRRGGRFDLG